MATMISGIIEFVMRVGVAIVVGISGYENGIFGAEIAAWVGATVFLIVSYYRSFMRVRGEKNEKK